METVAIAIIAVVIFGVATALAVFIYQLLLSRDKQLNDKAQQRALSQEARELEKIRTQMGSNKRFDSHYQILGTNRDAIQYLDQKIEEVLNKKLSLIQRYSEMTVKESCSVIDSGPANERKAVCDLLKSEIDKEIAFYDQELEQLQKRRASIWDSHSDLQEYLLEQEKNRNQQLDAIYHRHSGLLEKIYIRHNENAEHVAVKSIEASSKSFSLINTPLQLLLQFFKLSSNVSLDTAVDEYRHRQEVADAEEDINDYEHDYEEYDNEEVAAELT